MTDKNTRDRILSDRCLPIHRHYRGFYTKKDILELLLMGYSIMEAAEELCLCKNTALDAVKSLRESTSSPSTPIMLRKLVKKHRGYL